MSETEKKFVAADPDLCTGCSICELVCALEKENVFSPRYSRIKVSRLHGVVNLAVACRLCEDAPCVKSCPKEALTQSEETGIVSVDEDKCNGCGWCILGCEHGAITLQPENKKALICDLCEGEPKCVEWCPENALDLLTEKELEEKVRLVTVERITK